MMAFVDCDDGDAEDKIIYKAKIKRQKGKKEQEER